MIVRNIHTDREEEVYGDGRSVQYVSFCPDCQGDLSGRAKYYARLSGIPKRYMTKYRSSFDWSLYGCDTKTQETVVNAFVSKFKKCLMHGKGLYIHSATKGSGKTHLACVIANEAMSRHGIRVKFVYVSSLLDDIERARKEQAPGPLPVLYDTDLLILDDIGAKRGNDFLNDVLFKIADRRLDDSKLTFYTSNYTIDELQDKAKLDARFIDRIYGTTIDLALPEVPIRAKKADESAAEFLRKIL